MDSVPESRELSGQHASSSSTASEAAARAEFARQLHQSARFADFLLPHRHAMMDTKLPSFMCDYACTIQNSDMQQHSELKQAQPWRLEMAFLGGCISREGREEKRQYGVLPDRLTSLRPRPRSAMSLYSEPQELKRI